MIPSGCFRVAGSPLNQGQARLAIRTSAHGTQRLVGQVRPASSASSRRWQDRQAKDRFTRDAQLQGLKSRAAFKLIEMNDKYNLFESGQTVVDLGYAPGSWSQVAFDRTRPHGRVIGIDVIPSQPPHGVSTIQGNFLSEKVRQQVITFVRDPDRGRAREQRFLSSESTTIPVMEDDLLQVSTVALGDISGNQDVQSIGTHSAPAREERGSITSGRVVDVVLSDMSAPWTQEVAYGKKSLSDPYFRMMNTSGNRFRDHAGSMDLCNAALSFALETLRNGGSFVCKYYQGAEEKDFETHLKEHFVKVHREKPASSRSESREAYFVALRRKAGVGRP